MPARVAAYSGGTFTQAWDEDDRDRFVDAFGDSVESGESDYSMDSDEERQ